MANRLSTESSPYLLQHADNPVDWYPWGEEALDLARDSDRPILLSIGYSACHWCHVMESESFEDEVTASLMNEGFVNIKVDREERPDLDSIYMQAVQAMVGRGGWPLTVFLTPAGVPFFGGTYFPPEPRHGMPAFRQVLAGVRDAYATRREEITEAGMDVLAGLRATWTTPESAASRSGAVDPADEWMETLHKAARHLERTADPRHGGFGGAPKFPQPVNLGFLLQLHASTGQASTLAVVTDSLRHMARGGIRDHLGGGFHRYSVDAHWLVPHFEKMLYDNALLARLYVNAFQVTGDEEFRSVAEHTLDYVLRDLRSPAGAFYSARDADSEGEEGRFYVWTPAEIEALLPAESARLFQRCYAVDSTGNFEGRSILYLPHRLEAVARSEEVPLDELEAVLTGARQVLLAARNRREQPLLDDKVLANWNGLTLRALAEAGGALMREDYTSAAGEGLGFILKEMRSEGTLFHVYAGGRTYVPGFLDDYGAVGNALLTFYEATLEPCWLDEIRWVTEQVIDRFWDEDDDVFYDSQEAGESLVIRPRDPTESVTPSGLSLAVELLLRSAHLFDDSRLRDIARRAMRTAAVGVDRFPSAFGGLLAAMHRYVTTPVEVAIIGDREAPATQALLHAVLTRYLPNRSIAGRAPDDELPSDIALLHARVQVDGQPTAYLCEGYACRSPVTDPDSLVEQLDGLRG
ncbi:MAG: thioredoxin domain-containing protein [Gemmatimonadota bacterium]|nr:MAG: thioredoxin domain-containing protein [Gemmatimonadota bacterium]